MEVITKESAAPEIRTTTAVISVNLSGACYRRANHAAHISGLLWNQAVDWIHEQWKVGGPPSKYDIQHFLTALQ